MVITKKLLNKYIDKLDSILDGMTNNKFACSDKEAETKRASCFFNAITELENCIFNLMDAREEDLTKNVTQSDNS